jgi:hypothetical protein
MLTCMTTFALYAKTFTEIPFIFPSLIITLFLLISIEKRWFRPLANKAVSYRKFIITGICFVAFSVYAAGLFPPVEDTPYRTQFDEFVSGQNFGMIGITGIMDSPFSGSNNPRANDEIILFRFKTEDENPPQYLRRQVFVEWEGEGWYNLFSNNPEYLEWLSDWDFQGSQLSTNRKTAEITIFTIMEFRYFPAPPQAFNIDVENEEAAITIQGEFLAYNGQDAQAARTGTTYTADYYSDNLVSELFSEKHGYYLEFCLELPDYEGRDKVRELAHELTRDYRTDFEKARVIEQYFYNGEFVYDLNFIPQSKAVDYFLFESKRGTCSDFATAMTILAREAGIPARYVEGYSVNEQDESGNYIIRVKHAHAFPEVYIDGSWIIFEPTISGFTAQRMSYLSVLAILISVGASAAITVIFLIFAVPRIKEYRFRKAARNASSESQVQLIYNKIYGEFMRDFGLRERTLSSRDLDRLADSEYGVALCTLTENYDRVVYGGVPAETGDFFGVYLEFCDKVKNSKARHPRRVSM